MLFDADALEHNPTPQFNSLEGEPEADVAPQWKHLVDPYTLGAPFGSDNKMMRIYQFLCVVAAASSISGAYFLCMFATKAHPMRLLHERLQFSFCTYAYTHACMHACMLKAPVYFELSLGAFDILKIPKHLNSNN